MNLQPFIQALFQVFIVSPLILTLVYLIMFIYTFLKDHKENKTYLEKFSLSLLAAISILIQFAFAPQSGFFGDLFTTLNPYLFFIQTVICLFFVLDFQGEIDAYRETKKADIDKRKKDTYLDKVKQLTYIPCLMIFFSVLQSITFFFN